MKQRNHYRQILRLVNGIGRLTNPQHLPALKQKRVSLAQFLVLDSLAEAGGPLRMAELAHAAGLSPSELTRVVGELERKTWVERGADPEDSRAKLVKTTRAGARLIRDVHGEATAELRGVWSDFTHDECTLIVIHERCASLRFHSRVSCGTTAEAENQRVKANREATDSSRTLLRLPPRVVVVAPESAGVVNGPVPRGMRYVTGGAPRRDAR